MKAVAFVGLGAMGSRMATNFLKQGYSLRVYDLNPKAVAPLVDAGAIAANIPREAAFEMGIVLAWCLMTRSHARYG